MPSSGSRALVAAASDALLVIDRAGKVQFVNGQAERLFGCGREALLGQQLDTLVPGEYAELHLPHRASDPADPGSLAMSDRPPLWARRTDGAEFIAEVNLADLDDGSGTTLVLAAIRDITGRIEQEAAEQQVDLATHDDSHRLENLLELVEGVSHDISNLLGVVLNYTTLLTRGLTDSGALSDLGEIQIAAERAVALTRQLATFSAGDSAAKPSALASPE